MGPARLVTISISELPAASAVAPGANGPPVRLTTSRSFASEEPKTKIVSVFPFVAAPHGTCEAPKRIWPETTASVAVPFGETVAATALSEAW